MHLFWKDIHSVSPEQISLLPPERQARIARCRNHEDALRLLAAGLLLREHLGVERDDDLRYLPNGKPVLSAPDAPQFSLSHSGSLAVLLAADCRNCRCGVDVEPVNRAASAAVICRTLAASEISSSKTFSWFWTRKEATSKLLGNGIFLDFRSFSVLNSEIFTFDRPIALSTEILRGHFISCAIELP